MSHPYKIGARPERAGAAAMPAASKHDALAVQSGLPARDDEITQLREENARLRAGLRELRELLETPLASAAAQPKVFPGIGLL